MDDPTTTTTTTTTEAPTEVENMKFDELKAHAETLGVEGVSSLKSKAAVLEAIDAHTNPSVVAPSVSQSQTDAEVARQRIEDAKQEAITNHRSHLAEQV